MANQGVIQAAFKAHKPQVCKDADCKVGSMVDALGDVYVYHNRDRTLISLSQLSDPGLDIWEAIVVPWLQGFHNAD